jgi:hypothetical protein
MPCYRTGSAVGDARLDAEESRTALTETTRLLCKAMKVVERERMLKSMPDDVRAWWKEHKQIDKGNQ